MALPNIVAQKKAITVDLLEQIFPMDIRNQVRVKLWDGSYWPNQEDKKTTLVLNHSGGLRALLLPGTEVGMAEAYLYNDIDIEGDVESIFTLADSLTNTLSIIKKTHLFKQLLQLPTPPARIDSVRGPLKPKGKKHSIERDRKAVTYHYDVSNEFYGLWLDPQMVYSCGYFLDPDQAIDNAQQEKLDYLCKKLRLKPGQRLLDLGCGWGGLVICAAKNHGVDATGITLSRPQAEFANQRIKELGLSQTARVLVADYREIAESDPFDVLVSVGMFEHVGADLLQQYFEKSFRLLKPQGMFLNHGIATSITNKSTRADSFSDQYVFPDGELVPIFETLTNAESAGFEIRDVESLREHYVLTLRQWVKRLEENHDEALRYVDEVTYRVWRLYMSGSIHGFNKGRLNVYQSLLIKPDESGKSGLPLTREDWYKK